MTTDPKPIASRIAEVVVAARYEDLPTWLVSRLQAHVLDSLVVGLAAIDEPSSRAMRSAVLGSKETEATVIGSEFRARAEDAALVNGTLIHTLELDDDHRVGTVHPGAAVVPAALAAGEVARSSGKTFLLGVLYGYEIMCRAGEAFIGQQFLRGFHPTGTCGVFGAATAAGIMWGLDEAQLANALAIAGTQAAGLNEWRFSPSWVKRLHPGRSAQSGVLSARLAASGFTGPITIFEGPSGFLQAFRNDDVEDPDALTRGLGQEFRAALTAFKPYPGCRFAHVAVDIALIFRNVDAIEPADVARIDIRTFRTDVLNYEPRPASEVAAQFSLPYLVAATIHRGRLTLQELSEASRHDPEILSLSDMVTVTEDPSLTARYPASYPTEITLRLGNGRSLRRFADCPSGDPELPAYVADPGRYTREVETKADLLLRHAGLADLLGPLRAAVAGLPSATTLQQLTEALSASFGVPGLGLRPSVT